MFSAFPSHTATQKKEGCGCSLVLKMCFLKSSGTGRACSNLYYYKFLDWQILDIFVLLLYGHLFRFYSWVNQAALMKHNEA